MKKNNKNNECCGKCAAANPAMAILTRIMEDRKTLAELKDMDIRETIAEFVGHEIKKHWAKAIADETALHDSGLSKVGPIESGFVSSNYISLTTDLTPVSELLSRVGCWHHGLDELLAVLDKDGNFVIDDEAEDVQTAVDEIVNSDGFYVSSAILQYTGDSLGIGMLKVEYHMAIYMEDISHGIFTGDISHGTEEASDTPYMDVID